MPLTAESEVNPKQVYRKWTINKGFSINVKG